MSSNKDVLLCYHDGMDLQMFQMFQSVSDVTKDDAQLFSNF